MVSYLFIQVAGQDICFIEEGDITFPSGEREIGAFRDQDVLDKGVQIL